MRGVDEESESLDACAVIVEDEFISKNRELDVGLKSRIHPVE